MPAEEVGAAMLGTPIKFVNTPLSQPTRAPTVGQHTDEVLQSVLGYDDDRIAALRETGAIT